MSGPGDPHPAEGATIFSRREFLTAGGALVLGVGLSACAPGARSSLLAKVDAETQAPELLFAPDAFVRIASDDSVTVVSKHLEMGQGPYTGMTTLVADELDADWEQMRAVSAPADDELYANLWFGRQGTGGSTAMGNAYLQMRTAGAAARAMLVAAAATRWEVEPSEISISKGVVAHQATGRSARFGELAAAAAELEVPQEPRLKDPSEFVFIGKESLRIDSRQKSDGSARFTIDHYREGMWTVVVERPPSFGARVSSFDGSRALAAPGVTAVVEVPEGVAVYAENTWAAMQGRRLLEVEWDDSAAEKRSTEELVATFRERAQSPGQVAAEEGNVEAALRGAASRKDVVTVEAEYVFPYLAHAMMEPLDAVIEIDPEGDGEGVLVTLGCQGPARDHPAIAAELGLPKDKVRIDTQFAGGSFGRRSQHDAHFPKEVAHVFQAQPESAEGRRATKLLWTREDDIRGGYYRPMVVHRLRGAMTRTGEIVGWDQTIAAQSFQPGEGIHFTVVEGASDLAYSAPNLRVSQHLVETGIPVLWWRSVGHTHTGFAVEAFIDELLERSGRDAVEGRLALLADKPRHAGVLRRAAEMADWGRAPADGRAFGVAVHSSFRSYVAQIVELEEAASPARRPRVRRVWCAVDCGVAVNPNVIRAQMEGGIGFGLGAALYSEVHLDPGGRVRESNFDRYQNLRIDDMPEVEVSIVDSTEDPTGVGEPGVPPIAPAVANGWRRLTGERVERLPFVRET